MLIKYLMNWKIGALELALLLIFLEIFFGTKLMILFELAAVAVFAVAKAFFGGQFSLAQLKGLLEQKEQESK